MSLPSLPTSSGIIGGAVAALSSWQWGRDGALIQKGAVATSLVAIVLRVLCISFKKHENGFILWKVAIPDGMASGARGWLAAYFMKDLHDVIFAKILVTLIIVSGIQIWVESIKKKRLSKSSDAAFSAADKKN